MRHHEFFLVNEAWLRPQYTPHLIDMLSNHLSKLQEIIVEATSRRFTHVKIFESLIASLERKLALLDALPDPAYWEASSANNEENTHS